MEYALIFLSELLLPELGHIFEGLALGLRDDLPYEDSCKDTDDSVKAV